MLSTSSIFQICSTNELPPRVVVIALELLKIDKNVDSYRKKSAEGKINHIRDNIIDAYKEAMSCFPDSEFIIVVWREHGITDPDGLSISLLDKRYLDNVMQELTKKYKKLMIIAGSTLIRKRVPLQHLTKIKSHYQLHAAIKEEESLLDDDENHMETHENDVDDLIKLRDLNKLTNISEITKYKNISYVYYQDQKAQHGKTTPYKELHAESTNPSLVDTKKVFEPAKERNLSPMISFENDFTIGIEICREHSFSVLKNTALKNKKTIHLQFILSNPCPLDMNSFHSNHGVIHIDSKYPTTFVNAASPHHRAQVKVFKIDLLSPLGLIAIEPIYPIQLKLIDYLEQEKALTKHMFVFVAIEFLQTEINEDFPIHKKLLPEDDKRLIQFLSSHFESDVIISKDKEVNERLQAIKNGLINIIVHHQPKDTSHSKASEHQPIIPTLFNQPQLSFAPINDPDNAKKRKDTDVDKTDESNHQSKETASKHKPWRPWET